MIVTDRYRVAVPGDASDTLEYLARLAIDKARERTRLYCIPAEWRAKHISGEPGDWEVAFLVTRRRNKREREQ